MIYINISISGRGKGFEKGASGNKETGYANAPFKDTQDAGYQRKN